jgi:menaquinone-dependent protoporphyrinogen oxidase
LILQADEYESKRCVMRILIAYGSERGGTEGLANALASVLVEAGHEVDVRPGLEPDGLAEWDAVIVGGALYANHWHRHARRFVERHIEELRSVPVWFFSSGPLDPSASQGEIPPTRQVQRLMDRVHARGHVTFGGRLDPDAKGFVARALAKQGHAGDFRDLSSVEAWGRSLASALPVAPRRIGIPVAPRVLRAERRLAGALCGFTGLTAVGGGFALMRWPEGEPGLGLPLSLLEHSPFSDFFVPGLLLFAVVGLGNLLGGSMILRRHRWGEGAAFLGGAALTVWIVVQVAMLRLPHTLHFVYLLLGLATMSVALRLWQHRKASLRIRLPAEPPRPGRGGGTPSGRGTTDPADSRGLVPDWRT